MLVMYTSEQSAYVSPEVSLIHSNEVVTIEKIQQKLIAVPVTLQ